MTDAYRDAGVDIAAGNEAVERMRKHVRRTIRPEVLGGLGSFGGLFALDKAKYDEPVLVSGADGVGTKLKLAFALDVHDTIGIDAVAMCVNDIAAVGAEPLFFLDYLACDRVVPEKIEAIVRGISDGCVQAGCVLIGGETAEMPGMYAAGEYDIAGFAVGVVEKARIVDGASIRPGDVLLGAPSTGLHSNGFSLVRKLLVDSERFDLSRPLVALADPRSLGEVLLAPTAIYVGLVHALLEGVPIRGLAHITGGGFVENIPRILPAGLDAEIHVGSWPVPPIFALLQAEGDLSAHNLFRTFNMGIGMVAVVRREDAERAKAVAEEHGLCLYELGAVMEGTGTVRFMGEPVFGADRTRPSAPRNGGSGA